MDRQFTKALAFKFAAAPSANPGKKLKGLIPIPLFALMSVAPGVGHNPVHIFLVQLTFRCFHMLLIEGRLIGSQGNRNLF
jgi:hypothetical protein